jgi:hypothetical protein
LVEEFGFTIYIRSREEEEKDIKKKAGEKARCRVVERTCSWMNRYRCILVRWEKGLIPTSCHVALACGIIIRRGNRLLGRLLVPFLYYHICAPSFQV